MKTIIYVDEENMGHRIECNSVEEVNKELAQILDENVYEISIKKRVAQKEPTVECGFNVKRGIKEINILGVIYTIEEVYVVNKTEQRRGEINFLTNEIKIDKNMPQSLKNQVLMHEILHAVFDLLGLSELAEDEEKVQSIATALHQILTTQTIFS